MNFDIYININVLRACSQPEEQGGMGVVHVGHVQEKRKPADTLLIGRMCVIFILGEDIDMGYLQSMI